MVIIEESGGFVRPFGFHIYKARGFTQRTLRTDYEAIAVVGPPISHVIAFWASYFVAREIGRREEFDFCDDDCFVASGDRVWRGVVKLV